jgi:CubicO group peptidase (beta-lactamase class C family)
VGRNPDGLNRRPWCQNKYLCPNTLISTPKGLLGVTSFITLSAFFSVAVDAQRVPYDFGSVERRITEELKKKSIPSMVVSVARDGRIVYERAFGYSDLERKIPSTVATAYRLGSISKPLTATGLMVLYQRGLVNLDLPAQRYMGPLKFQSLGGDATQVTLRQLLNHTSGLAPYFQYSFDRFRKKADRFDVAFQKYGAVVFKPGTLMEYSNTGFALLGEIIAAQSKQPFPEFMQKEVLRPLRMTNSFFERVPNQKIRVAAGYDSALKRLPELFNNTSGAGNAYASVHDLMLFAMFHLQPEAARRPTLSKANVSLMSSYIDSGALYPFFKAAHYGLGWYIREDDGGVKTVWHEGGMPGASSFVKLIPGAQVAAAALTNVGDKNPLVESIVNDLIKIVLPSYRAEALNPTANYKLYSGSDDYRGKWKGTIMVNGRDLPCSLTFDSTGLIHVSYGNADAKHVRNEFTFRGVVQGASFIGSFSGPWPAVDIPQGVTPILVMHLIKEGKVLSGRINAYSANSDTVQFFYPFYIRLDRVDDTRG